MDIIRKAFYNSYNLISNKIKFSDLVEEGVFYLAHEPGELDKESKEKIIKFFEKEEEYEICAELLDIFAK